LLIALRIALCRHNILFDDRARIVRLGLHLRDKKLHIYLRPVIRPQAEGVRPVFWGY
jgi:hypothetical protein